MRATKQEKAHGPPEVTPSMTENDARPSKFAWPFLLLQFSALFMLSSYIPWYLTLSLVFLYFKLKNFLYLYFFGLEELTPMDYFFLYDNYKNRANVLCVSIWHKFDYEKVRA